MEKLTVKDAMKRLNCSQKTIRRMLKRGDLPNYEKVNRKIEIPLSDIEAYEQRQGSTTPPNTSGIPHVSTPVDSEIATPSQHVEDAVPTLTVKETMARLKISEATIRRMISRGEFPNLERKDRKIHIPLSDITAYKKRQAAEKRRKTARKGKSSPRTSPLSVTQPQSSGEPVLESETVSEPTQSTQQHDDVLAESNAEGRSDVPPTIQEANKTQAGDDVAAVAAVPEPVNETPDAASKAVSLEQSLPLGSSEADVMVNAASDPVSSASNAVNTGGHDDESLKDLAIQGGIMTLKGLKQIVNTLILGLEQYQERSRSGPDNT